MELIIEDFKDIEDIERQIIRSDLHSYTEDNKIIMSKENIEKLRGLFREFKIDFDEENFMYDCVIGGIPIVEGDLL